MKSADPNGTKVKGLVYHTIRSPFNKALAENLQDQWQDNLGVNVDLPPRIATHAFFKRRTEKEYVALP